MIDYTIPGIKYTLDIQAGRGRDKKNRKELKYIIYWIDSI